MNYQQTNQCEQNCLGLLIKNPETAPHILMLLTDYEWCNEANQNFFSLIRERVNSGMPLEATEMALEAAKAVTPIYVATLIEKSPQSESTAFYANKLLRAERYRKIEATYTNMRKKMTSGLEPSQSDKEKLQKLLNPLSHQKGDFWGNESSDRLGDLIDEVCSGKQTSIRFGFDNFDHLVGGFRKKQLNIIAARPGVGKTAFALNLAMKAMKKQFKVMFVSLEMSDIEIISRCHSMISHIDGESLANLENLSENSRNKVCEMLMKSFRDHEIDFKTKWVTITNATTVSTIQNYIRDYSNHGFKPDLLFIDYIGLLSSNEKFQSREREIATFSREMKQIAMNEDICVIALSQLNREIEKRSDPRPQLSDLRDSGSIEQDANKVIMLYDAFTNQTDVAINNDKLHTAFIRKNREGKCGEVHFNFYKDIMRFIEC